jgi:hypothetical protein
VTLAVHSARPTRLIAPSRAQQAFLARTGADLRLDLVEDRPPEPSASEMLFDSGGVWRTYRHGRQGRDWLYAFETTRLRPRLYKAVVMDRGFRRGVLYFPRPTAGARPRSALDFPLDELLFQHYLARRGGLEVHACAVEVGRRALLFCGVSGAGKTTTARLWERHRPGTRILSDDRVVLRLRAGRVWAFGTPWHGLGRYALPAGRPLAAVFFLEHARETRGEPLSPPAVAARLFARGFPPPWDRAALARVLDTCSRVALRVPGFRFGFRKDASAVRAALEAVGVGLRPGRRPRRA